MTTRVLLADDHALLRAGLRSLIESQDDLSVVAEATNGRDAVQMARELTPDLVIIDITMPGMNGIEATAEIRDALPNTSVIALSMHATKRFVDRMLAAGATGYLLKDCAFAELRATITLKLLVNSTGRVTKTRVRAPTYLHKNGLYRCVKGVALGARFAATGAPTVVTFPFSLSY